MAYNTPHSWTAAEDAYLAQTATHLSIADIASVLGVTQMVAVHRCKQLGIEFRLSVWKQIAVDRGEDTYFYPIPCKRGHIDSLRRVNCGACLACESIRGRSDAASNSKRRYKAKRRQLTPTQLTSEEQHKIDQVYEQCRKLTLRTGILHHVDHIIPLAKGGLHQFSNLQILTAKANQSKSAKLIDVDPVLREELAELCNAIKPEPKWSQGAKRREDAKLTQTAAKWGVPEKVFRDWSVQQRTKFKNFVNHNGFTYEDFCEAVQVFGDVPRLGLLVKNARRAGVTMSEWQAMTHKQRNKALKTVA